MMLCPERAGKVNFMRTLCIAFLILPLVLGVILAQNTNDSTPKVIPTPTPVLESHSISAVISGDLLKIDNDQLIALTGIHCYEPFDFGWVDQMNPNRRIFADLAMARTSGLVTEKNVYVQFVSDTPDALGRQNGYVYLPDRRCLNEILLDEGLAQIPSGIFHHRKESEFQNIVKDAKKRKVGIWGIDPASISIKQTGGSAQKGGSGSNLKGLVSLFSYLGILGVIIAIIVYIVKILQSGTKNCPMCQAQVPKRDPRCQNCGYNYETGYLGSAELQNWVSSNIKVVKKRNTKGRR